MTERKVVKNGTKTSLLGRSVRTPRYRYTDWGEGNGAELYDHQSDPREHANLAADPKHQAVVTQMRRLLKTTRP